MISGGIEVNWPAQIRFISEVNFADDSLLINKTFQSFSI